jgi:MoaA/NifB/PqqE/SkfB family radical SAM enzyme
VNKVNVPYLPDIVKFFMRLSVYEFDILQIIPFGRGFSEYKETLFYKLDDYKEKLTETWKLSRVP